MAHFAKCAEVPPAPALQTSEAVSVHIDPRPLWCYEGQRTDLAFHANVVATMRTSNPG